MKKFKMVILLFCFPFFLFAQTANTTSNSGNLLGGADVAYREGNYEKAIEICRAELRVDSGNFNSWFFLTRSLLQSGQYALTKSECQRALRYFPTNAALHEIQGAAAFYQGNDNEALEMLSFAIENGVDSTFRRAITWFQIASIYLNKEQYHQALSAFNEAIRLNPSNMEWRERSAFAHEKAGLKKEAIELYQEVFSNTKSKPDLKVKVQLRLKELDPQFSLQSSVVPFSSASTEESLSFLPNASWFRG